jgi:hypothetical protein
VARLEVALWGEGLRGEAPDGAPGLEAVVLVRER